MIRERLALLMTALVMVVCLGVAQAQSADSTPTRFFTLRIRDWRTTATTETIQQPATATPTATPRPGGPTGPRPHGRGGHPPASMRRPTQMQPQPQPRAVPPI